LRASRGDAGPWRRGVPRAARLTSAKAGSAGTAGAPSRAGTEADSPSGRAGLSSQSRPSADEAAGRLAGLQRTQIRKLLKPNDSSKAPWSRLEQTRTVVVAALCANSTSTG